ncbi:hypothetical protein L7F22_051094 [Adiantum nelumboides]|nr:hypothetical protein [Adiantum nelumboides]
MASLHPSSVAAPKCWRGSGMLAFENPRESFEQVKQLSPALHATDPAELLAFFPSLLEVPSSDVSDESGRILVTILQERPEAFMGVHGDAIAVPRSNEATAIGSDYEEGNASSDIIWGDVDASFQGCREDYRSPLIFNVKARNVCIQAAYQIAMLLTIFFKGEQLLRALGQHPADADDTISDRSTINTIIFNSFALCQLFDAVNARQPKRLNIFRGLRHNPRFIGILGTALLLQVAMVELGYGVVGTWLWCCFYCFAWLEELGG